MKALAIFLWGLALLSCFILALSADTWPEGLFWGVALVWCCVMPFLLPPPRRS